MDYGKKFKEIEEKSLDMGEQWKREQFQYLCLTDMYFLLRFGCGIPSMVMDWPFVVDRCTAADMKLLRPKGLDKDMIMVFRGGFKSTIFNNGAIIQRILAYPENASCIFSFNKTLAKKHMRVIKETLEESERLQDWFPEILYENPRNRKDILWSEQDGLNVNRQGNRQEPTLMASGLTTGMPTGMHFNHLCYDDVVTKDSVKTPYAMDEVTDAFEKSMNLTARHPGAMVERWILGTFYKYNDTYCRILEKGIFNLEKIPWIDPDGNYYMHTDEQAEEERANQGPYNIATQMELEPVPQSDKKFDIEKINYYDRKKLNIQGMKTYLMADLATNKRGSRQRDTDFTALWVIGKDRYGNEYWLDGAWGKMTRPEAVRKGLKLTEEYDISWWSWEEVGAQEDQHMITEMADEVGLMFHFESFSPKGVKEDRIESCLLNAIHSGKLQFPPEWGYTNEEGRTIDLMGILKLEMNTFPEGHKDFLDCGSQRAVLPKYGKRMKVTKKGNLLNKQFRTKTSSGYGFKKKYL